MTAPSPRTVATLLAAALLAACASTHTTSQGEVGVTRHQYMVGSGEVYTRQAEQAYRQTLAQARAAGRLNSDPALVRRIGTITDRLVRQVGAFRPEASQWPWEVAVLHEDTVNAWCMAGGKMAIYTGIIDKLKLADDEIAAVMGHEIAHALREHTWERASQQQFAQVLQQAGSAWAQRTRPADAAEVDKRLAFALDAAMKLPFSRTHEKEADRIGVELAARAGYDPGAAVRVWQKMARLGGSTVPEWQSTHPSAETRIRELTAASALVRPLYEQARTQ